MIDGIIQNIIPLLYEAVEVEIKRLISENGAITSNNITSSNATTESNYGGFRNRIKCTAAKCQGPHSAADCFSKPENFAARDKKMRELIAAGKWRGHIPTTTSTSPPATGNHTNQATINELTSAMRQMSTQSNKTHTTVLNAE